MTAATPEQLGRYVPARPKAPARVRCETCLDLRRVWRILGGLRWPEPCPACEAT
jgi:hypothetical protein